jgi:hypothetical protein
MYSKIRAISGKPAEVVPIYSQRDSHPIGGSFSEKDFARQSRYPTMPR